MMKNHSIGKRGFIQNTSKYLKLAEEANGLIITHNGKPVLFLKPLKSRTVDDLKGFSETVSITGDINDPILPGFDEWESDN